MKFTKLTGVILAGAMLLSGCSASNSKVAMQIGDSEVTEGAIKFFAEYGVGTTDATLAADYLEQNYLIYEVADEMDLSLTEAEEKQLKSSVASFKAQYGGKKAGDKILRSFGLDDDDLEIIIAASIYAQKVFEEITIAEPTDDEMKQYFRDNFLRAKHVLVSTQDQLTGAELDEEKKAEAEAKANDILARAQSGEDFDALIAEYNEDPGMESNTEGYFFTDGEMVPEFENTTKELQPGEIKMCKTDFGYHIIKRLALDETPESFDKYFEENKSKVKSAMSQNLQQEALKAKADSLGITIEIKQDVIGAIVIEEPETEE